MSNQTMTIIPATSPYEVGGLEGGTVQRGGAGGGDTRWLNFFDPQAAYQSVLDHCNTLASANTAEKYTLNIYRAGIEYFMGWAGVQLPTKDLLKKYIVHLKQKGYKASTITSKYLSPVRIYLESLMDQMIFPTNGQDFLFVMECKELLRQAKKVKSPKKETTSNRPAMYQHGTRLSQGQVNEVFESLNPALLRDARDLALLYLGFTTGLRVAEIARMTPASIQRGETCWEITVRGKRNNIDPVPADQTAVDLIHNWIEFYNSHLDETDPRYIAGDTPLWQPLTRHGTLTPIGSRGYNPANGYTIGGLSKMIQKRVGNIIGRKFAPHDMRRTCAALGRQNGMDYDQIKVQLRHKSIGTTATYVGNPIDLSKSLISNYVHFTVPSAPRQQPLTAAGD